jgi:hypothetical protein
VHDRLRTHDIYPPPPHAASADAVLSKSSDITQCRERTAVSMSGVSLTSITSRSNTMQTQYPENSTAEAVTTTFRIGDRARYILVKNTPQMAHVYIKEGVIVKIEDRRATLRLPDGRGASVFLNRLSLNRQTHALSRALSRRSARHGRRTQ